MVERAARPRPAAAPLPAPPISSLRAMMDAAGRERRLFAPRLAPFVYPRVLTWPAGILLLCRSAPIGRAKREQISVQLTSGRVCLSLSVSSDRR